MLDAERPQEVALRLAAGGGEDLGANLLGDLNRGQTNAAGPGVNQHPLARLQLRQAHQAVVRGEERDRNRARLIVID